MMSKVASTIRLDRELREEAEKELNQMGLTLTAYLNLAVKQLVIQKEVPFKIKSNDGQDEMMNPVTRRAIIKALAEEEGLIKDEGEQFNNVRDAMNALLNHGE